MESKKIVTADIVRAKESIKRKLSELKRGVAESTAYLREHAAPIVGPLTQIADRLSIPLPAVTAAVDSDGGGGGESPIDEATVTFYEEPNPAYGLKYAKTGGVFDGR